MKGSKDCPLGIVDQPTQRCRPQHMVVCADPIHFQNGGPVIVVGCRPQHVLHAICPGSRGQCVLEWGTFYLKIFRELPRQRRCDQPTECASSGDSSHTSVVLGQCSQPGIKGPWMSAGTRPCATLNAGSWPTLANFGVLVFWRNFQLLNGYIILKE